VDGHEPVSSFKPDRRGNYEGRYGGRINAAWQQTAARRRLNDAPSPQRGFNGGREVAERGRANNPSGRRGALSGSRPDSSTGPSNDPSRPTTGGKTKPPTDRGATGPAEGQRVGDWSAVTYEPAASISARDYAFERPRGTEPGVTTGRERKVLSRRARILRLRDGRTGPDDRCSRFFTGLGTAACAPAAAPSVVGPAACIVGVGGLGAAATVAGGYSTYRVGKKAITGKD
jgi:hypothetical protein